MKEADCLSFYAGRFNAIEIDSTFYRIPTVKTVQQWRERTPDEFIFAAKVPQSITHEKVLVDDGGDLKAFLGVMELLEPKLGPLLIQLPCLPASRAALRHVSVVKEAVERRPAACPSLQRAGSKSPAYWPARSAA
jgi:uncharacterized protein YecE (DUF72 family)